MSASLATLIGDSSPASSRTTPGRAARPAAPLDDAFSAHLDSQASEQRTARAHAATRPTAPPPPARAERPAPEARAERPVHPADPRARPASTSQRPATAPSPASGKGRPGPSSPDPERVRPGGPTAKACNPPDDDKAVTDATPADTGATVPPDSVAIAAKSVDALAQDGALAAEIIAALPSDDADATDPAAEAATAVPAGGDPAAVCVVVAQGQPAQPMSQSDAASTTDSSATAIDALSTGSGAGRPAGSEKLAGDGAGLTEAGQDGAQGAPAGSANGTDATAKPVAAHPHGRSDKDVQGGPHAGDREATATATHEARRSDGMARDGLPAERAAGGHGLAFALQPATDPTGASRPSAQPAAMAAPAQRPADLTPMQAVPITIGLKALEGAREFEIRLDPAELGRVDVKLSISEDGRVQASLVVDRVETLALLQRDARTLERAFDQAGLTADANAIQFSLRQDNGGQNPQRERFEDSGAASSTPAPDSAGTPERPAQIYRGFVRETAVDIRV